MFIFDQSSSHPGMCQHICLSCHCYHFFPWKTEENAPAINATVSLLMNVHMFVDDVGFSFTFLRSARLQSGLFKKAIQ